MSFANAIQVDCNLCNGVKTAFEFQYTMELSNGPTPIRVARCINCDGRECERDGCDTRTLNVKAKACPDCRTPFTMPPTLGLGLLG